MGGARGAKLGGMSSRGVAPAKLLRARGGSSKIACAFLPARRVRISSPVPLEVLKAERKLERWRAEGRCSRCWLRHAQCVCSRLAPLAGVATNRVDVALSVHYKEWGCTKSTAKLLPLVLEGCRATVYPIEPLLPPRRGPTLLLFPGEGSQPASSLREWAAAQQERVTLVVVDGTWSQARTMARQLAGVTRVHVSEGAGESLVLHRKQPRLGHVSTLEATALALRELGEVHAEAPLLTALRLACDAQAEAEARTSGAELLEQRHAKRLRHRAELHRAEAARSGLERKSALPPDG